MCIAGKARFSSSRQVPADAAVSGWFGRAIGTWFGRSPFCPLLHQQALCWRQELARAVSCHSPALSSQRERVFCTTLLCCSLLSEVLGVLTQLFAATVLTSTSAVLKKCWLNGVAQKGVWSILFTERERLLTPCSVQRETKSYLGRKPLRRRLFFAEMAICFQLLQHSTIEYFDSRVAAAVNLLIMDQKCHPLVMHNMLLA